VRELTCANDFVNTFSEIRLQHIVGVLVRLEGPPPPWLKVDDLIPASTYLQHPIGC